MSIFTIKYQVRFLQIREFCTKNLVKTIKRKASTSQRSLSTNKKTPSRPFKSRLKMRMTARPNSQPNWPTKKRWSKNRKQSSSLRRRRCHQDKSPSMNLFLKSGSMRATSKLKTNAFAFSMTASPTWKNKLIRIERAMSARASASRAWRQSATPPKRY